MDDDRHWKGRTLKGWRRRLRGRRWKAAVRWHHCPTSEPVISHVFLPPEGGALTSYSADTAASWELRWPLPLILLTPPPLPLLRMLWRQHKKQRNGLSLPFASAPMIGAVSWDTDLKVCLWEFTKILVLFQSLSNTKESTEQQDRC